MGPIVVHHLVAQTEGNPFFLEESVRTLVETKVLAGERGAYRLAQALPTIQVPATVQAILAACRKAKTPCGLYTPNLDAALDRVSQRLPMGRHRQ